MANGKSPVDVAGALAHNGVEVRLQPIPSIRRRPMIGADSPPPVAPHPAWMHDGAARRALARRHVVRLLGRW